MPRSITSNIEHCRALLQKGELVALPTETVYGLAANCFDAKAVEKIFKTKGRPKFNPLIVHIHALEQLATVARSVPEKALLLAKTFWPGPLTMVLPKNDTISGLVTAGNDTVGVRMPNHPLTLKLLQGLDFPVVAPSANPFMRVSPTTAQHVNNYFGDAVTVLDGGPCVVGLESTIVGFEGDTPVLYRKGGISVEALEAYVGTLKTLVAKKDRPIAPGMLPKHYAPKTRLVLTEDIDSTLIEVGIGRVGLLTFFRRDGFSNAEVVKPLSKSKDLDEAAKNLFRHLHELDALQLDLIIAERLPESGLGSAINDRLERAKTD